MTALESIVVGLDLDPRACVPTAGSLAAAQTALWLAQAVHAHVTLLHSVARDEYFDPLTSELVSICDTVTPEARLAVGELVARFRAAGVACETVDSSERPSLAVTREVQRQRADLVLIGKHDGREVDATRIGPIALRVLRECPSPVWTVIPGRAVEPRRVVAATDLTAAGEEATRWAASISDLAQAELHVVHVHPPALHTRRGDSEAQKSRLLGAMQGPLTDAQRARAQLHLREAPPARGVLSLVEELEPDLVCLGIYSHKKSPSVSPSVSIGSTAERLLARLESGVLALKPA